MGCKLNRTLSLLALLAIAYSPYFAADILLPVALAVYLNLLLSPIIRRLQRADIPSGGSALVLVTLFVASVSVVINVATEPTCSQVDNNGARAYAGAAA